MLLLFKELRKKPLKLLECMSGFVLDGSKDYQGIIECFWPYTSRLVFSSAPLQCERDTNNKDKQKDRKDDPSPANQR
jgi:hypothetical protein